MHLGRDFFTIHNLSNEDRARILTSRWKIGKDPLLVRLWKPNFNLAGAASDMITLIWINLPSLSIEYHSPQLLIAIGNLIRTTVLISRFCTY